MGRIQSRASLATAHKVFLHFGRRWSAVEAAAKVGDDGIHRISLPIKDD